VSYINNFIIVIRLKLIFSIFPVLSFMDKGCGYNLIMCEILPLQPHQTEEARRVIYMTAYDVFRDRETLEETIALYRETWPLVDIDDFQERYSLNGGIFLVLCQNDRIIGTGALRRMEDTIGEIKRLWILPEYQGKGLGYRMMLALLAVAREKRYARVRLETDAVCQKKAVAFYQRMGFYEIPRYGTYEDDIGMELVLDQP
jgi:putative acetyltransferase